MKEFSKNVISAFLLILNSRLKGEKIAFPSLSEEELKELFMLSKAQDLSHIVAEEIYNIDIPKEIKAAFTKEAMIAAMRSERLKNELPVIKAVLNEEKMPFIPLKGSNLWDIYPEGFLRVSCDIDILVRPEDLDRGAMALSKKLSYEIGKKLDHDIPLTAPYGVHLELHFSLLEGSPEADAVLSSVWEHASKVSEYEYKLDGGFFLFYHLAHMAKHVLNGGCGLRPFADLYVIENIMNIKREKAEDLIKKAGLESFADNAFKLSHVWFSGDDHTEVTEALEEYIINSGIYGSLENLIAVQHVKKGKTRHILEKFFLPYDSMKLYYPSVAKCPPILYPLYQFRRWFRILFCDGPQNAIAHIKTNNSMTDQKRDAVASLKKELGL